MPKKSWTAKDERQYEHVKVSCLAKKRKKTSKVRSECARIAAATVNKQRAKRKSRRGVGSCACSLKGALKAK